MKYKVKLKVDADLNDLATILVNLRRCSEIWHEHYGAVNKEIMKYWQRKADRWIEKNVKENDNLT